MPKKTHRTSPRKKYPHISAEDSRIVMVALSEEPYCFTEIRRTWLRQHRKFLEALLAAAAPRRKRR